MNLIELNRALKQLRLGAMAAVLETRLLQAQSESMAPIDLISCLVADELSRRSHRLLERRQKQAQFRDPQKTLDNFDFTFNKKLNRSLVFDLATAGFIAKHEDALFLGPPGTGKSHLAQAIGLAALQQGYHVLYRETHTLLDEIAEATIDGSRKHHMQLLADLVSNYADPAGADDGHLAHLARREPELAPRPRAPSPDRRCRRCGSSGRPSRDQLDVVDKRSERDNAQRHGVPRLHFPVGPRGDRVAHLELLRRDDVALLAVDVVKQRDPGAPVGVVLDVRDLGRNPLLVPLEVDDPVLLDVPAASKPGGNGRVRGGLDRPSSSASQQGSARASSG